MSRLADEAKLNPRLQALVLEFLDGELSAATGDLVRAATNDDMLRKQGAVRMLQHMRSTLAR